MPASEAPASQTKGKARFAAIDVGSNAMRLRIIEASAPREADGKRGASIWKEVANARAAVRLGTEVFTKGRLAPASIGEACAALREFRQAMDDAKVDAYRATATSAVREAENGATLVERALREAGIELDVIEGVEEARLIELAVVRNLDMGNRRVMLIDVGGGSTELTLLDAGKHTYSISLPIGTVRLLETLLREKTDDVAADGRGRALDREKQRLLSEMVDRAVAEARVRLEKTSFELIVGTGGNVETLADLCPAKGGIGGYARAADVSQVKALFAKLARMSPSERQSAYNLRPDRADTIVPAAAIFLRLAEVWNAAAIAVPGVGLKEGILEELVDKHFHLWDSNEQAESVLAACARLGHRYHFDEAHGQLVARLATQLFDDMQPLHAFGERDRLLLRAAALLHDIGDFVRYDGHHKHTYYLILNSDIIGLSPEERAIVANTARYHRKSLPDPSHPNFRELEKDARGKVRGLAAILRIADALDREHLGKVEGVRATIDKGKRRLLLKVTGKEDRELEEWTVKAKSELLREVFDLDVAFD